MQYKLFQAQMDQELPKTPEELKSHYDQRWEMIRQALDRSQDTTISNQAKAALFDLALYVMATSSIMSQLALFMAAYRYITELSNQENIITTLLEKGPEATDAYWYNLVMNPTSDSLTSQTTPEEFTAIVEKIAANDRANTITALKH